jgi:hypothetical protein
MRRAATLVPPVVLLAGPTVLAFCSGGYFADARLVALVVAFLTLALAVATADRDSLAGLYRDPSIRATLGGLLLLGIWTWVSASWAPLEAAAIDSRERTFLYFAIVAASVLAFARREVALWVEPALAAGIVIVVGYGVLGDLGVIDVKITRSAGGRLDQPLTYWNAMGALAAIGFVLCVRIAGSRVRPFRLRVAAAAAAPMLGLGVYLTFSRGGMTALAVGLAVLLAFSPTWSQLRSVAIGLEAAVLAVAASEALPDAAAVVVLAGVMLGACAGQGWSASSEDEASTRTGPLPHFGRIRALAWVAAAVFALVPFVAGVIDKGETPVNPAFGATAERFGSSGSHRYSYWRIALRTFADEPATGVGAGGFAASWLERRTIDENVRDAHSLPLETAAELGVIGLLFLALMYGGVVSAVVRSARDDPSLVAGPTAALAVWAAHSAIDWDWEMPALTLIAAALAGLVLTRGYHRAPP